MKIVCSLNMPYAREAFTTLGEVLMLEGRAISADDVRDAQVLALRSTTKVNSSLLDGSSVEFVGTATIGTDHMDKEYLDRQGIKWSYSPGCNANSVAEYITSALLCLADRHGFILEGKTIGVVGVGNVGSLVAEKAEALGLRVLLNDPPRERNEQGQETTFVSLNSLLEESDIVTLHVPLTDDGLDPTVHMADREFFEKIKTGCIFINAARGGLLDTDALLNAMDNGVVSHVVADTWEGEPDYRMDLLERVDIGSPHIAGHSFEGKVEGTVMVYRAVCDFLGVESVWTPDSLLPPPLVPELVIDVQGRKDEAVLWDVVRPVYDVQIDDQRLRDGGGDIADVRRRHFDGLRKNYPIHREFRFTKVQLENAT
ncbi:MAG: 4-phosphoerythronate dehydrogenase, partial [Kiritimatiellae bacterium]|nr:4-phosphoerythronate dehydrogenase [Kiritimatiellia bacterium]